MNLFEAVGRLGHEQVVFFHHRDSGLRCVIAIHSTVLGPALGGLRMWPYANEADAVRDVLKHSADMTYKAALAGLNLGGRTFMHSYDPDKDPQLAVLELIMTAPMIVTSWINRSGFSYPARSAYGFSSLGKSMKRIVLNSPQSGPGKRGMAGAFSA